MTKLKYHKIRGIEKSVCTAEQKIAYNIAFRIHINHEDEYKKLSWGTAKAEAIGELVRLYIKGYMRDYENSKYNVDAIQACLHAGLQEYLEGSKKIYACYEDIGKAFPAYYL